MYNTKRRFVHYYNEMQFFVAYNGSSPYRRRYRANAHSGK